LFVADLACAETVNVLAEDQLCEALVTPIPSQPELEPSPQENWYWTGLPRLETDPPVLKL
jgi:hypothetical protein